MKTYHGLLSVVGLAVVLSGARADSYSKWIKDEAKKVSSCTYSYQTKEGKMNKQTVMVYHGDAQRAGWAYFYNAKNEPWARVAIKGNPMFDAKVMHWQQLNPAAMKYEDFKDKGFCPAPKDGKAPIPTLPLPPE